MKGISRIDSGSTHGWFVRGYRNGKAFSKLFSDRKCGGKGKALKLAKSHRDELLDELEKLPRASSKRRAASSGVIPAPSGNLGVSRTTDVDEDGTPYDCYKVSWRAEPGREESISFSVETFGEEDAFNRAVNVSRERVRELEGEGEV